MVVLPVTVMITVVAIVLMVMTISTYQGLSARQPHVKRFAYHLYFIIRTALRSKSDSP